MKDIIASRKKVVDYYNQSLDFSKISKMKLLENTEWNYSYYPVIFESEDALLKVQKALNAEQIFPRRYFYPSLNTVEFVSNQKMAISESVASRILCLPLYYDLSSDEINCICEIIKIN
jgi:dTDP-4-amino-4,6-dideoxygalactose transaminase